MQNYLDDYLYCFLNKGVPTPNDLSYQSAASFQDCCNICESQPACKAWTYVFSTRVCWLKTQIGTKVATTGSKDEFSIVLIFSFF